MAQSVQSSPGVYPEAGPGPIRIAAVDPGADPVDDDPVAAESVLGPAEEEAIVAPEEDGGRGTVYESVRVVDADQT
jgi:hypothetical protein